MASSAARVARKRLRAREAGLCVLCFTASPQPERSVCKPCSEATAQRVAARRAQKRQLAQVTALVEQHERAADEAGARHLYAEAAAHYQNALGVAHLTERDRTRISEKLANALSLGPNPAAAIPLLDNVLISHHGDTLEPEKAAELLLRRARQAYLESNMQEALRYTGRALALASDAGNQKVLKLANLRMASYLFATGEAEAAQRYIDAVGVVTDSDDAEIRMVYGAHIGFWIAARSGNAIEAYGHFESAVSAAKLCQDVFAIVRLWNSYAQIALLLGNIELAKSCYERALFAARQYQVTVELPEVSANYAGLLMCSGRYELACEHLREALSCEVKAPIAETSIAEYGLPLALRVNDEALVTRCARPSALEYAFQVAIPGFIAPVAASFAQWHASRGRARAACQVLHRALNALKQIDQSWDLPIAVARFGNLSDIPRARKLLAPHTTLPNSKVAQASMALFEAFVAQRDGREAEMRSHALAAVKRFDNLGWYGFSDLARTLCPASDRPATSPTRTAVLDMLPGLTPREQEVAQLVLKGLTNRQISEQLSISKHTVDSHVASIIGRLGIRSRHQLVESAANEA